MSNSNRKITALYFRLSQEDIRDGESLSIENQRLILQKYADDHSEANFNRPAYKEMMNEVESGNVSTVIVKDQSGLGRDYLQTGMLMKVTFPQYDVRFIAINDGVDSATAQAIMQESETTSMTFLQEIRVRKSEPCNEQRERVSELRYHTGT